MSPWNDATDRQLLLTIIHLTAPQLPKWDEVAKLMGDGFTAESTRQHFQKMRKGLGKSGTASTASSGSSPVKGTPSRKSKAKENGAGTPSKSTGKRKSSKKDTPMASMDEDADKDDEESPTKKVKADVKAEGEESDGYGDLN